MGLFKKVKQAVGTVDHVVDEFDYARLAATNAAENLAHDAYVALTQTTPKSSLTSGISGGKGRRKIHEPNNPIVPGPIDPSKKHSRFTGSVTPGVNIVNKRARCVLPFFKGVGYTKPGPIFTPYKEKVEIEFAFDLTSVINARNFMRMGFRTYHQGSILAAPSGSPLVATLYPVACTLSPSLAPRTIGAYSMSTAVRDASSCKTGTVALGTDCFYPTVGLYDLETYSWNANPFKYVNWHSENANMETQGSAGSNYTPLNVFKDQYMTGAYVAEGRQVQTPFFASSAETFPGATGFVKKNENFLCNLGAGSVDFHINNRYNTPCVVEVLVIKLRRNAEGMAGVASNIPIYEVFESMLGTAYALEMNSGNFINAYGFQGEIPVAADILTNPNKSFLTAKRKFMPKDCPVKEVCRSKHVVSGGSKQQITITLPPIQYDAIENRKASCAKNSLGVATDTQSYYARDIYQPNSYCIYVAVHGVIMPAFPATVALGVVTNVQETVVDTVCCSASILVHGKYRESPQKCLSVSPTYNLQNRGEIKDTDFVTPNLATQALVCGFVPGLPVAVTQQSVHVVGTLGNTTSTAA